MKENELQKKLDSIKKGLRLLDTIIGHDYKSNKHYISEKQKDLIKSIINLFKELNWQIALNSYKNLNIDDSGPLLVRGLLNNGCGTPVKVRPCDEKYNGKTYFGILIGDIPLQIGASIDKDGTLNIKRQMYNPAIFVPEISEIIYGCGSWWGEIESEEDLNILITEETINNVWYMKLLRQIG